MTVSTMTFRTARQRNVILAVVGASMLVSLLLLSQTHSRLRRAEGDLEKCQQKHDSVAAQLTVLYEHKARLDKTLQAEIERKKLVDDELKTIQAAFSKERVTQSEKQAKMLREFERLKENGTEEISRMRSSYESLRREKEKLEADVEELNSQAQRLRETNHKLEEEVRKMQQSEPIDMNEVERLRERVRQCDSVQPVAAGQEQSANERQGQKAVLQEPQDRDRVVSSSTTRSSAVVEAAGPEAAGEAAEAPAPVEKPLGDTNAVANIPFDAVEQADDGDVVEKKHRVGNQFMNNDDNENNNNNNNNNNNHAVHRDVPLAQQGNNNANAKVVEGEDRDYPDNVKDDDAGADDADDGVPPVGARPGNGGGGVGDDNNNNNNNNNNNPHLKADPNRVAENHDLDDLNNANNNNNANNAHNNVNNKNGNDDSLNQMNNDLAENNINYNDLEMPRSAKVLPRK